MLPPKAPWSGRKIVSFGTRPSDGSLAHKPWTGYSCGAECGMNSSLIKLMVPKVIAEGNGLNGALEGSRAYSCCYFLHFLFLMNIFLINVTLYLLPSMS